MCGTDRIESDLTPRRTATNTSSMYSSRLRINSPYIACMVERGTLRFCRETGARHGATLLEENDDAGGRICHLLVVRLEWKLL